MGSSVCRVGAGAHYPGWLYGLCAEKPPLQNHENAMINCENALQMVQMHSKVILLGGIYAVLVSLGKYVWVSVGK